MRGVGTYAIAGDGRGAQIGMESQVYASVHRRAPTVWVEGAPDGVGVVVGSD
jgi:hypothetical protein